jgi:hypothetical protein
MLLAAVGVLWFGAVASAQGQPNGTVRIPVEFATGDLRRDAAIYTAAGEAANRGADLLLDRAIGPVEGRGAKKVAVRLARLWFVTLPIAALTEGAVHNAGHFARADEAAPGRHSVTVTHWPWPIPLFGSVEYTTALTNEPMAHLAVSGGGEQSASALRRRLTDEIYSEESADYFAWVLLGYAALDFPTYAWSDLRPSYFESAEDWNRTPPADFRQYALTQGYIAGAPITIERMRPYASRLRRSAWLNLADVALWSGVRQTARYVITGERALANPTLHLGGVRFIAGAYASLGSVGLERGVDVRFVQRSYLTRVNLRHVSLPAGGGRWGGAIAFQARQPVSLRPEGQIDVWKNPDGSPGLRIEAGLRRRFRHGAQPLESGFRVGYKSEGYLDDVPSRKGPLLAVFTTVRF